MNLPKRKSNRLIKYDYSRPGAYFITICTYNRANSLSHIVGGGVLDAPILTLTEKGRIVEKYLLSSNNIKNVSVKQYVIMPNHIHMLIELNGTPDKANESDFVCGTSRAPSPTNATIPHFVSTLKRFCNAEIGENIFQRSFHDHVVRNRQDYEKIAEYIHNNPSRWKDDCFYNEQL